MKKITISFLLVAIPMVAFSQLKVNSNGRVVVADTISNSTAILTVGKSSLSQNSSYNIGLAASPVHNGYKTNVGLEGVVVTTTAHTLDANHGVRGFVSPSSDTAHGKNFGVSGIYNGLGTTNGTGIYGASSYWPYIQDPNIPDVYAGYFDGKVYISTSLTVPQVLTTSDIRLKDNIVSLKDSERYGITTLDNILKMDVIEYNLKDRTNDALSEETYAILSKEHPEVLEDLEKRKVDFTSKRHFGLSAQEIQTIYPNLIEEGKDGYLSLNYTELVPILIRSIQELNMKIEELRNASSREFTFSRSVSDSDNSNAMNNKLYQNIPNPFKEQTTIRFQLADDAQNAAICIFDMTGKMLKKLPVSLGDTSVKINGWELGEGMFLYTLIVNGREIDTKRMIITR